MRRDTAEAISGEKGETAVHEGERIAETIIEPSRETAQQTAARSAEQARESARLADVDGKTASGGVAGSEQKPAKAGT